MQTQTERPGRVTPRIEPAKRGRWSIERFTVNDSEDQIKQISSRFNTGRYCPPGEYTKLVRDGEVIMSDTPDELRDLLWFYYNATGRVLINGLGLGCALTAILSKESVTHVDVVEVDLDVIALVRPYFESDDRVVIHEADAFTMRWPRGAWWDVVWNDVWDDLNTNNLSSEHAVPGSYATIHRKYARRSGWQGSWGFELLRSIRRREAASGWW